MGLILAFLSSLLSALRPQHPAASGGSGLSWAWYLLIVLAAGGAIYLAWRFIAGRRGTRHAGVGSASGAPDVTRISDPVRIHEVETEVGMPPEMLPEIEVSVPGEPWLQVAHACTRLVAEIERAGARADVSGRAIAEHASSRLREIVERAGAGPIE